MRFLPVALLMCACASSQRTSRLLVYSVTGDEPAKLKMALMGDGDLLVSESEERYALVKLDAAERKALMAEIDALRDEPKRQGATAGEGTALVFLHDGGTVVVLGGAERVHTGDTLSRLLKFPLGRLRHARSWTPRDYVLYFRGAPTPLPGAKVCSWKWELPPGLKACVALSASTGPTWDELTDWKARGCREFEAGGWYFVPYAQPKLGRGNELPLATCLDLDLDESGVRVR